MRIHTAVTWHLVRLIVAVGVAVAPLAAIAQVATTTVLTVVNPQGSGNATSTATSVYGQPVGVTLAVTAASGAAAPDGSASVYVDGLSSCTAMLGSPVGLTATGTCNLTVPIIPTPVQSTPHVISASYTGTATFASSASSGPSNGSLTVNKAATTTTITAHTPDPSVVNSPIAVTVSVAVTPPGVSNANPMLVQVSDGSAICSVNVRVGQPASCNLTPTTAGTKTLIATNFGDSIAFAGSVSPGVSHTVTGGGTTPTTTVVAVVNPQGSGNATSTATSVYGQPVAVTVAVTAASGAAAPDGSASVYVDGLSSCVAMLGSPVGLTATGTCNLTVPIAPTPPVVGTPHVISASYTGTATFASSASSGAGNGSLTVNMAATTTTITAHTPDPSVVNSPIVVTVLVAVTPPGVYNGSTLAGQVSDGSAFCSMNLHAGQPMSCNLTPTTAGTKTLIATGFGDGVAYARSVSPGVSHNVTGGGATPTTTVVTVVNPQGSGNATSAGTSVYGQPVAATFAVTAASGAAAPDGSASVYVDGFSSCTATLGSPVGLTATGTCNLTVPIIPTPVQSTPHVISASYTGTATFASSASSGPSNGSLTVNKAATTTTITAHTPDPSVVNSPIAVTVSVAVTPPGVSNANPMLVQVSDGSAICSVNVRVGQPASCNLTPTTAGTKTLIATNFGDSIAFAGSVSPGVSHTVTGGGGATFTGPTVAPGVNGTVTLSGGGASCVLVNPAFIAAPLSPPEGTSFPFGLFDFSTSGCTVGGTITVQIVYSQALPAGTQYWKFGPTPGNPPHWYLMPGATVNGTTVNFSIQDGQIGDDDLTANGSIVDQGGPGASTASIPTLNDAALALLALILVGLGWAALGRRAG